MNGESNYLTVVAPLWQEHRYAPYPDGLRRKDLAGIGMVELDFYTAGCVSAFLHNGGSLDAERHRILDDCIADLDQVLPLINEPDDLAYFQRLRRLAQLVSDSVPNSTP
ncbi:hypothetical protein ACGFZK_07700 [Streptomyces sp. NPDC048257]|uniref:hypothetical protein n=1 Tax=Streptomyces sp. NPDC048257 TaxID=3365526 RepID=UPI00371A5338